MIIPEDKIKVFISSACGEEPERQKYNYVRAGLKALIESTHFAKVYMFESKGASIVSAYRHYSIHLKDCDVCIFLIDNKDGIYDGVQKEIDIAYKYKIKALYYFCDEFSKEKTPLEKSLEGASFAKSNHVNSFTDLVQKGASDLVDDLVLIYKCFCKGHIDWTNNKTGDSPLAESYFIIDNIVPKDMISNIDNCKNYFSQMILKQPIEKKNTNEIDDLCNKFLPILFEGKRIDEYNLASFLDEIEKQQSVDYNAIVKKRWQAIRAYFLGDLNNCILILQEALDSAKNNALPDWVIKDILLDLRNQSFFLDESQNRVFINNKFQKELDQSEYLIHYPLLDRFDSDFYEKFPASELKRQIQSPYTITFGHDLTSYTDLLASIFLVAMFNGSLTHLQTLYKRIEILAFHCCAIYSDWNLKTILLKTAIINCNTKEIDSIIRHYNDILCKMDASDAKDIYNFAHNRPINYQRFMDKLEALKVTVYFMGDDLFEKAWEEIYHLIIDWIENKDSCTVIGYHIYNTLREVFLRIKQEELALICYQSIKNKKRRFFDEIFKLISDCIKINEILPDTATKLIDVVIKIVNDENERTNINTLHRALYSLRKQNREFTDTLDKAVLQHMPEFYDDLYKFETTEDKQQDMPLLLAQSLEEIKTRNASQGVGGKYFGFANRPHLTIKHILKQSDAIFVDEQLDPIFVVACQTLLQNRQTIEDKMDAIEILVYLCKSSPTIISRNANTIIEIKNQRSIVESGSSILSNLNEANLRFSSLILYSCLDEEVWTDMIEILADIGDDTLSQIQSSKAILFFLEADARSPLNLQFESILLNHSLSWCNSMNLDVRWHAIKILFALLRNPNNYKIVCNQLVKHMDTDNVFIKTSILRKVSMIKDIDPATYKYILQKASLDTNYVVRKVLLEVKPPDS